MTDHTDELETALRELEELTREGPKRRAPDRYDARGLLIPLGTLLREEDAERTRPWLERARLVAGALGEKWQAAVVSELALACAEHVHAVDTRYLDLPNYDFAYTCAARDRLELRLLAARALEVEVPEALVEGVRRADRVLAPYLAARDVQHD